MTEERKQELRRLLHEAMEYLEIRQRSGNGTQLPSMNIHRYKTELEQYWILHSLDLSSIMIGYEPYIVNEATKAKFLTFISEEFSPFIYEGRIQSVSSFIVGQGSNGYPLDILLERILNIAIVRGTERAVSDFHRCTEDKYASFQYFALLEGIRIETEIQILEGIRLVPLPPSTDELPNYLPCDFFISGVSEGSFIGKTILIIDASVSPIFHKPTPELFQEVFQVKVGENFLNFKVDDFYQVFCQALSIACNSAVQILLEWRLLAEDEPFNLHWLGVSGITQHYGTDPFRSFAKVEQPKIAETRCLYERLTNLNPGTVEKLQIPINRWIKSKASRNSVDKMVDLGIAFESLYLADREGNSELSFQFRLRASWHLGKDKADREMLIDEFKAIYNLRSAAVHSGKLDDRVRIRPGEFLPTSEFINKAQDLCRDSILKILEDGKFPDWNNLILGEVDN